MPNDFNRSQINPPVMDENTLQRIGSTSQQSFWQANKWYIVAIGLALVVIGILAYLVFFTSGGASNNAAIKVSVEAPETVPSSSEVVYRIIIENQDKRKVDAGELELVYPEGAVYLTSVPPRKSSSGALFPVPGLVGGQNAVVSVKLRLSGSVGANQEMLAKYRYSISGSSTKYESLGSNTVLLMQAGLKLSFDGPVNVSMNQLAVYNLTYQNDSKEVIKQARIRLVVPNNFTVENSQPERSSGELVWNIGDLAPESQGKITISGAYKSGVSGQNLTIEGVLEVLGQNGSYLTQASTTFNTAINASPLSITVENESNKDIVNPGQRINYQINYANNGNVAIHGVNLEIILDGKGFDLSTISAKGAYISGSTVTWNASSVEQLENLAPNQTGSIRFSVGVKNPPVKDSSKNLDLKVTSRIYSDTSAVSYPGAPYIIKIATQPKIDVSGSHISGPIPLKVGEVTEYKIRLTVTNTTNDISDTVVTAFMPLDPSSFDTASLSSKDSSQVRFDPQTGKLTWNAGLVPAYTGSFQQPRILEFKLKVKPQSSQSGKTILLMKNIAMTAKDVFTGENVSQNDDELSTNMITSNGVVQ